MLIAKSAAPSNREILESEATWHTLATVQRSTPQKIEKAFWPWGMKSWEGRIGSPTRGLSFTKVRRANLGSLMTRSRRGLNDAYTSGEQLRLQDIDYVSLMCLQAGRMSSKSVVSVTLSSGRVLTGKRAVPKPSWKGRTLDLRKAYKQMAVSSDDRHLMVLTHLGPSGPVFYISDVLPFGARGSVYSFLRTSRALSFLMNVCLTVPGSVFFDVELSFRGAPCFADCTWLALC